MSTRHLVDPELFPVLDMIAATGNTGGVSADTLAEARDRISGAMAIVLANADQSVSMTEHHAPGREGARPVRLLVYRPENLAEPAPVVIQIHGGGYVMGTPEICDTRCRKWAKALGCVFVSVDYRLAPEHPFPAGLEDCYTALLWAHDNAAKMGFDAARIAVAGESAGGGLAAGLALLARDRGGPAIVFQLLVYPMLDDRTSAGAPRNDFTGEFMWTLDSNHFGWASWLGRAPGSTDIPYLAAPARATDLAGLPPAMIATAALDLFVDEDLDYAVRLIRAGVPTEVHVAPGAFHGFDTVDLGAGVTRRFIDACRDALGRAFETRSRE